LQAALQTASTPAELLVVVGHPALALRYPPAFILLDLLVAASHEAALRRHPYVTPEHVVLAACREVGDTRTADAVAVHLEGRPMVTRRWWRPLGRNSALRPHNQVLLDDHQRAARAREERRTN
jgi:hypothetical protein